jgi:hypothetical protein
LDSSDEDGQSIDGIDCGSQSAVACTSNPDVMPKYPRNNRKKTEIQMNVGNRNLIITINRTDRLSIFNLPIRNLSELYRTISLGQYLVFKNLKICTQNLIKYQATFDDHEHSQFSFKIVADRNDVQI